VQRFSPILLLFSLLSSQIYDVSIPENDTASYNYADFRIWINDSTDTLRGIYWFMHPNNGDSRNIVTDSAYQSLVNGQDFALMGAHIFNMHMETGIGDAVIAAMDSFAVLSQHDEISFIPFFINGYSWGGQFGYHFTKWIPERMLGFITQKGGYHDTTDAGDAIEVPGLMFVAENDLPYRIENLTGIFLDHRPLGAKWALAMEQDAGHTQITDQNFLNSFFNTVTDLRLPQPLDVFQPVTLITLSDTIGWLGNQDTWIIGDWDCYDGIVDSSSWFLAREEGELWQNFVSEGTAIDTSTCEPVLDSNLVIFSVGIHGAGDESDYVVSTDNDALIDQCRSQLELPEAERMLHINGFLDYGDGGFNQPWGWHIIPNEWVLAEMSIGICNAYPENVENDLDYWINTVGQLCNWSSFIKEEISGDPEGPWAWINDGYASGTYMPGDTVHIWSGLDPVTMTFQEWTGDTFLLADTEEWHTTFIMPNNDVHFYALQDSTGPIDFEYEIIQGPENPKNVYYKFPENSTGTIFFFHGGNGSAENIVDRIEIIQFFQDALQKGYGIIITESENATLNTGLNRWLLETWTLEENIDIANIQALIDTFTVRGNVNAQDPIYSAGVSNGGNFSSIVAHALNFNAAAMYSAQGNPPALYLVTETPTVFCPAKYDPAIGGGNWAAQMNFDTLQARNISSAFYELDRSPAYPQRFARIPGIDLSLSNDLFNEFQSMGFLNNDQYFTVLDDSIQHLYITNPDVFSVLSTLDISTVRHVLDQIKVITADHSFFADYNERVLEFFSEHSTGPDFWQLEDIPQGYNYLVGSGPEGHVMVAGTNPNGGTPALFYSENDDLSWTPLYGINNPAPMFRDVIISGDGRIYIPDFAYGVFYSDNYGQTWTGSGEFTPDGCAAFGLHPSGVLFAGLASGIGYIHRSADNGSTWEAIPLPDYDSNYAVEHIHFNTQGHVFLGTINGIYRSTDVGASWDQVNDGLNGVQVYSMTIDDQDHIYILTTQPGLFDGYYRSMDNGRTWEALDWVQDINYALDIVAVDGHIYAINDQNIFITIDEGQTWSELTNGLSEEETFNLGADLELTSSGYLYAAGRYVHRSSQPVFSPTMDIKPINVPKIFSFKLFPAYPNPFNPTTTIQFSVETHRNASLQIFDITGQLVETLVNGQIGSGFHEIKWNAGGFASGVYFVRLQNGNHLINQKLLLLK